MYKKTIFLIPCLLFSGEIYLNIFGASKHFKNKWEYKDYTNNTKKMRSYNENNYQIGLLYEDNNSYGFSVTRYKNSFSWESTSILAFKKIYNYNDFNLILSAGAVNGYGYNGSQEQYFLMAFPSIQYKHKNFEIDLSATNELIFLQGRIKIK